MPWHHDKDGVFKHHPVVHPVKKAGFASYTDDRDRLAEYREAFEDDDDMYGGED